jgi:hypothetical protein
MRRVVIVGVVVVALLAASYFTYERVRPKSDRERIEEACGPHALDPGRMEPAYVGDDGTICCGGLCGTT